MKHRNSASPSGDTQPKISDVPALLMQKIRKKTISILGEPNKVRQFGSKKAQFFIQDGWTMCITRDRTGREVIFFISEEFTGGNKEIQLYRGGTFQGKMMTKLREDSTGESFIQERILRENVAEGFTIPAIPVTSSLQPDGAYYNRMRDQTIAQYIEKRRDVGELFFFKTYEEYLQLVREGFICEKGAEMRTYQVMVIYADGKADEYYTLTGLLSCEPTTLSRRPGQDNNRSIETVLKAEGVIGWEILGIFPDSST